jgi:hypothetical protein
MEIIHVLGFGLPAVYVMICALVVGVMGFAFISEKHLLYTWHKIS